MVRSRLSNKSQLFLDNDVERRNKLPDPYKWVVKLWVNGLQVFEDQLLVQHAFVERQRKACVDELAVEKCLHKKIDKKRFDFFFYFTCLTGNGWRPASGTTLWYLRTFNKHSMRSWRRIMHNISILTTWKDGHFCLVIFVNILDFIHWLLAYLYRNSRSQNCLEVCMNLPLQ